MSKIYILEGPDGTGKSTLALEIIKRTKGHYLHCSYKDDWNIEKYHNSIIECAYILSQYQDVVIDRWAPSEYIYSKVFRGGESYDTKNLIQQFKGMIIWIYCWNENDVKNHKENKIKRGEVYGDISLISEEYSKYIKDTKYLNWHTYNFDRDNKIKFVKELIG